MSNIINSSGSFPHTCVVLCIDTISNGIVSGRIISYFLTDAIQFSGFDDLFLKLDLLFDTLNFPQASRDMRRLIKNSVPLSEDRGDKKNSGLPEIEVQGKSYFERCQGEVTSILLHVIFRQHSSWQGKVSWVGNRQKTQFFRSVLELLHMLDDIVYQIIANQYGITGQADNDELKLMRYQHVLLDLRIKMNKKAEDTPSKMAAGGDMVSNSG